VTSTRLVLWRHGQTAWNAEGRIQGQHDAKLDDTGRAQAKVAARQLASRKPDLIVSSDLSRCSDTAAELAALTGLTPTYDVRLRERGFGDWQTLTRAEVRSGGRRRSPGGSTANRSTKTVSRTPGRSASACLRC